MRLGRHNYDILDKVRPIRLKDAGYVPAWISASHKLLYEAKFSKAAFLVSFDLPPPPPPPAFPLFFRAFLEGNSITNCQINVGSERVIFASREQREKEGDDRQTYWDTNKEGQIAETFTLLWFYGESSGEKKMGKTTTTKQHATETGSSD